MTVKTYSNIIAMICISCPAMSDSFDNTIQGEILHIATDTTVLPTAWIKSDAVHIDDSLYLYNRGRISSNVYVCDACNVYIQNSGEISGVIHVPIDANLTQIIKSADDATRLNINGEYNILVYNAKQMDWFTILHASDNAANIMLANSDIIINQSTLELLTSAQPTIELIGENNIWINQSYISTDIPVLSNIIGDGTVNLHMENMNPLYALAGSISDGNLYAKIVRETDYVKILGSDTGKFLNTIRALNPNDKLLDKLDAAQDMPSLHHILNKSMRINPNKLAQPLHTFNRHIDTLTMASDMTHPMHFAPIGIIGDNINAYGVRAGINIGLTDAVHASVSAHAANMNFTDGIDDYSANLVGGDIVVQYDDADIFACSHISITGAKFITPAIMNSASVQYNPMAIVLNADVNAGPRFTFGDAFVIVPFLGLGGDYSNLLNTSDTSTTISTGIITEYSYKTGDIQYKYSASVGTDGNGRYNGRIQIGLASPDDDATVYVGAGVINDEIGMSYSATASIVFNF